MEIPEKVKIGGHEYTCKTVPCLGRDHSANGRSCGNSLEIEIEETLPQQNKESTLIHEILEQINYRHELDLPHEKISILETALYQIMRDNPQTVKFIMGEE